MQSADRPVLVVLGTVTRAAHQALLSQLSAVASLTLVDGALPHWARPYIDTHIPADSATSRGAAPAGQMPDAVLLAHPNAMPNTTSRHRPQDPPRTTACVR